MITRTQKDGMFYMLHLIMADLYKSKTIRDKDDEFTPLSKALMRAVQELEDA